MPPVPTKLRKAYVNLAHPVVVLRFEDGHEILISQGKVKTFDAYGGEMIRVVAVYDPTSAERELLESVRAEELPDAEPHESR
jgi:hypothetical protein